ncbi:C4-dicarboxylate transporter [Halobacteroides halobius DSM 5150]|uniref:C4-dicarboxylate transporter n=1 Tax=Halobacteroides halobius (strain ATCC 35273 / DSM 5150 / MD-1) TaxID=748449 RepID=L0KAI0_HALHC|nr:TRAP transporter large permease subunit [Halobacteroides halobius]AGB41108.1 C4-dicarboxylate transporter [Halobacteroides halobius DSM 5150]
MSVTLSALHWAYLSFIVFVIGFMVSKRDTSLICILGIFTLGLLATGSLPQAVIGVFNSLIYAIKSLRGTILIISIIYGMSQLLKKTGINEVMVSPFAKLIRTPSLAYWVIGLLMMVTSWFFWPSPAVALLGAVLLPVATEVGLPAMGVAVAMNLFGHGIALSGDFVIQGAPKLTADAAGIPVSEVVSASVPLVFVMGIVTTITAFWFLKRDLKKGKLTVDDDVEISPVVDESKEEENLKNSLSAMTKRILAFIIPILFVIDVVVMIMTNLQGGDATALVGGTAVFILMVISLLAHKNEGLEEITEYLIEGLQFGFKVFTPVIPIAAFFYMGDMGFVSVFGEVLPAGSNGLVNDLGVALAEIVPLNKVIGSITLTIVGTITGLDGSGFSGISLAGSVARLFSISIGTGIDTLTALGQVAGIWVGGGTLVPWALLPVAAICDVSPFKLAKRNLIPVTVGLVVTTIVAIFLI